MAEELEKVIVQGALERPEWVPTGAEGLEGMTKDDIQLPRIGLAQGLSPELDQSKPQYIDGLKNGDFFNNLTKEIYGRGPLTFAVIQKYPPRYVEFIPRPQGGGVRDFNVPADDPRTQFTKDENGKSVPPVATKFYDYVVLLYSVGGKPLPRPQMLAMSFKSSGLKTARKLNGLMQMKSAPIYAGVYSAKVGAETNAKGTYNVFVIDNAGWQPTKEAYEFANKSFNNLVGKEVKFEREPGDEEHEEATSFDPEKM